MQVTKLVPIIAVDAIEPCLDFWTARLGFEKTVEVPHEGALGFVILARNGIEVMYQTFASIAADAAGITGGRGHGITLYLDVDDIDAVEQAMRGVEVVVARRTTFYGAEEIFVRAPCGTVVGFARHQAGPA